MMQAVPFDDVMPGFRRPQSTDDDLVAEYEAWVQGEMDGHDKVISSYREHMAAKADDLPTPTDRIKKNIRTGRLRHLRPILIGASDKCDCWNYAVLAQLEGRLAAARGRVREYQEIVGLLEQQIEAHKQGRSV